jgi:hypothetical protein
MRFRPEAAGESGQGWRERVQKDPCRTLFRRTTCDYHTRLSRSFTGCSGPGKQPGFAAATAQTGLLSKPKKKASLNSPPIGGRG